MGLMDKAGKDLYVLVEGENAVPIAIQCKGFELPTFEESQFKQCLASISTLRKKGLKVDLYVLLINRQIQDSTLREQLNIELQKLVEDEIVEQALLLEPNSCVKFVFDHHFKALKDIIVKRNLEFKDDYAKRMDQNFYLEAVPFEDDTHRRYNPSRYIRETRIQSDEAVGSRRVWTFVQSEFGFGKTSLLLQLPQKLEDVNFIYIPLAQMERGTFSNERRLVQGILSMLLDTEVKIGFETAQQIEHSFLESALSTVLRSDRKLVLLYDGLDENEDAYTAKGLEAIFTCAVGFVCSSIFSMRQEFIDERRGNFQLALKELKQQVPKLESIQLVDWRSNEIVKYVEQLIDVVQGDEEKRNISALLEVVKAGRYEDAFGDIPKRPLFLKMLSEDIRSDGIKEVSLSGLYQTYLSNKFCLDEHTSVSHPKTGRPIELEGDHYAKLGTIFSILTAIAGRMYEVRNDQLSLSQFVDESDIKECIAAHTNQINDIVELMLASVLIPFSERSLGDFKAKFAHKSFQEYFTARYLLALFRQNQGRLSETRSYAVSMPRDEWLFVGCTAGVRRFFTEFCEETNTASVLNFYVSSGDDEVGKSVCNPENLVGLATVLRADSQY
jgi:hypothetical protein